MELRRALARTRQDLQRSRGRGASSSDEVIFVIIHYLCDTTIIFVIITKAIMIAIFKSSSPSGAIMIQIIPIRSHVDGRSSPGASLAVSTASPTSPASTGSPSCKSLGDFWEVHSPKVKPRELVAKLRSMTETIKMLSTENVALREENDGLVMMRGGTSGSLIESHLFNCPSL